MNDALRMQISAFVDGELPENETELLLRRLSQDLSLRRQAAEYLHIGRLIRREREVPGMNELRNRIATALGEQPDDSVLKIPSSRSRYLKPAAGVAIAASVALLALVGLRQVDVLEPAVQPGAPAPLLRTTAANNPGYTEPPPSPQLSGPPSEMLMQYYLRHGETSAGLGANGILTRLVTFEMREGELVEVEPGTDMQGTDMSGIDADNPAGEPENSSQDDNDNHSNQ